MSRVRSTMRVATVAHLACMDAIHDWRVSLCMVVELVAVLSPLLVLFGLRLGVRHSILEPIIEDPSFREIRPAEHGRFEAVFFDNLRTRSDVQFLVPAIRYFGSLEIRNPTTGAWGDVELVPSGPGDPLLVEGAMPPFGYESVELTEAAAVNVGVRAGDAIELVVTRTGDEPPAKVAVGITGLVRRARHDRAALFASAELLAAIEDFREGLAVPSLGWPGRQPLSEARPYSSFRMYARTIRGVESLRADLARAGVATATHAREIDSATRLDRDLGTVFWVVAATAALGWCTSLVAFLWASVERKRANLGVLRMMGLSRAAARLLPVSQAVLFASLGWLISALVAISAEALVNGLFADRLATGQRVCAVSLATIAAALPFAVVLSILASAVAATRSVTLSPSELVRGA